MRYLIIPLVLLTSCSFLTSCSYNVSMAHTEGTATDIIDDNMTNQPDVSPNLSIPVK